MEVISTGDAIPLYTEASSGHRIEIAILSGDALTALKLWVTAQRWEAETPLTHRARTILRELLAHAVAETGSALALYAEHIPGERSALAVAPALTSAL